MSKNLKKCFAVAAISISSAVIGSVATAFYIKHRLEHVMEMGPHGVRGIAMKMLRRKLNLSKQQVFEIRPIVKKTQQKMFELRRKHRPEIEIIMKETIDEINPKLTPEQREEFDKLNMKMMKRFDGHSFNKIKNR